MQSFKVCSHFSENCKTNETFPFNYLDTTENSGMELNLIISQIITATFTKVFLKLLYCLLIFIFCHWHLSWLWLFLSIKTIDNWVTILSQKLTPFPALIDIMIATTAWRENRGRQSCINNLIFRNFHVPPATTGNWQQLDPTRVFVELNLRHVYQRDERWNIISFTVVIQILIMIYYRWVDSTSCALNLHFLQHCRFVFVLFSSAHMHK